MKIMLTLKEAVELTSLSYYFLRRLCLSEKIFCVRSGTKFLINRNSLLRYLGETGDEEPEHSKTIGKNPNSITGRDVGERQN